MKRKIGERFIWITDAPDAGEIRIVAEVANLDRFGDPLFVFFGFPYGGVHPEFLLALAFWAKGELRDLDGNLLEVGQKVYVRPPLSDEDRTEAFSGTIGKLNYEKFVVEVIDQEDNWWDVDSYRIQIERDE
jgi:hypothetical protein